MTRKYNHYFRPIPPGVTAIDLYRFAEMFEVTDSSLFHALKKIVAAGKRGSKTVEQDVQEAIDSLQRWQEMRREETPAQKTEPERDNAPADSKPKTFMFNGVELKAINEPMCIGCFAADGRLSSVSCDLVNDAAKKAGLLPGAGFCGNHGIAYVRA